MGRKATSPAQKCPMPWGILPLPDPCRHRGHWPRWMRQPRQQTPC